MKRKSIITLAAAVVLVFGTTSGSYAWFTSNAESKENVFKSGMLGITNIFSGWKEIGGGDAINLTSMQPGDIKTFTYTVSNKNDQGKASTLGLKYKMSLNEKGELYKAARYDVSFQGEVKGTVTGDKSDSVINTYIYEEFSGTNGPITKTDLSFDEFKSLMEKERIIEPAPVSDGSYWYKNEVYTVTIKLPETLGNEWQDKTASFMLKAKATQNTSRAVYSEK